MGEIDRQYLEPPFFGSRRMKAWLDRRGMPVSRKRVQRLMRAMGLRAIYRRPGTSRRAPEHPVYPYLLLNVRITRPNQSLPSRRRGYGRRTSPICPWPVDSSTWWPSWTGTAGTCWPGGCPTPPVSSTGQAFVQAHPLGMLRAGRRPVHRHAVHREPHQLHVVAVGPVSSARPTGTPAASVNRLRLTPRLPGRWVWRRFFPPPKGDLVMAPSMLSQLQSNPFSSS